MVHLDNVDVEHNVASNSAGAILNDGIDADITVVRSRISKNSAYDAAGILKAATEREGIGYGIVFATSITDFERLSRTELRELLGYEPVDDIRTIEKLPNV